MSYPTETSEGLTIKQLLYNVKYCSSLCNPFFSMLHMLQDLCRWKSMKTSAFAYIVANFFLLLCPFLLPYVLYLVMLLLPLSLGILQGKTNIFKNCFPTSTFDEFVKNNISSCDGGLPTENPDILVQYRLLLRRINVSTSNLSSFLSEFYEILRFKDKYASTWWFSAWGILCFCFALLPCNFFLLLLVDLSLFGHFGLWEVWRAPWAVGRAERNENVGMSPKKSLGRASEEETAEEDGEEYSVHEGRQEVGLVAKSVTHTGTDRLRDPGAPTGLSYAVACAECRSAFSSFLRRRCYCCHCGNQFCSRCCSNKVAKSVFGATAPSAKTEMVMVCNQCFLFLSARIDDNE